jgi:uncharacterized protein (TIGR00159 family)
LTDAFDVLLVALLLWAGIVWLRHTRARLALISVMLVAAVYLAARRLDLELTAWILQGFFAVFVLIIVVVFQDDLRRLFEQLAVWGLRRKSPSTPLDVIDTLARAVARLAETRTGALIVIPGREPLERHVEGGIALDARVSEALILSLFDTHSPGHDGAVFVMGDRVSRFAVHLPLSSDLSAIGEGGTRHAAALGLAERSDALCVVVSEERGIVSIARDANLRSLSGSEEITGAIREFLGRAPAQRRALHPWRRLARRWPEGLLATGLACGLWLLLGPGSTVVELRRSAPVVVENLPEGYALLGVEPSEVQVTVAGRRRDLYLSDPADLRLPIDALLVQLGRRTFEVSPRHVQHPKALRVLDVAPARVRLSVERAPDEEPAPEPTPEPSAAPPPQAP